MIDLRPQVSDLARSLERVPARDHGRLIMLISAETGEGTSSIAASLAVQMAARASRSAWLIDLDLGDNPLFNAFKSKPFNRLGGPGRPLDASLGVKPFYEVRPDIRSATGNGSGPAKLLAAHQIEGSNLFVTRFRTEHLRQGQHVHLRKGADYWMALRNACTWGIIDAPSIDISSAGLTLSRYVDGVVIVMRADKTTAQQVNELREEVEGHGGRCLGAVVNKIRGDALIADQFAV